MFSFSSLLSQLFTSRKTRRTSLVQSKAFSRKPFQPTKQFTQNASEPEQPDLQIENDIELQLIVGKLKEQTLRQISSLLSLGNLWIQVGVIYLKAKMTTFVQKGGECMLRILLVISKSKEYMLQIISMI